MQFGWENNASICAKKLTSLLSMNASSAGTSRWLIDATVRLADGLGDSLAETRREEDLEDCEWYGVYMYESHESKIVLLSGYVVKFSYDG